MTPSRRFKPIQTITSQKERKAAAALGESLKQREAARQRLAELQQYLAEYRERFTRATQHGLSGSQVLEYLAFIGKLESAIVQQEAAVHRSQQDCDSRQARWRGRYTKSKAMEKALDRLSADERRQAERREQAESDDRAQRKR